VGNLQITERDRRMLAFAAEHRFVLGAHVAMLLGISAPAASARLRALRDAGYLSDGRPFRDEPPHYRATTAGLRAISSALGRPPKVDLSLYRHDAGLAWLRVAAERGMFGPLQQIVPERQMRSHDGRAGDGEEPFGVRVGDVGRDGRPRLHYPDLVVVTDTGHRVAFELELTLKGPRRRERILAAYAGDRRIDAVIYLVDHPARRRAMQESARRVGIADRVRVEQVTVGHRPEAPSPSRRTVRRTARHGAATTGAGR
jgi:DNA-binding transcriptional ArsR family regulator